MDLFSTCPPSTAFGRSDYLRKVIETAQWSEAAGCKGILVYSDNSLVDPWLVAQVIVEHTETLSPLVAVQPLYMHPYTVAKKVASLGYVYGRRICLNMVAGGFSNDLVAFHDSTPHDERYLRLVEYSAIVQRLLSGKGGVTYSGRYYQVTNLRLTPALDGNLTPGFFVSGSSGAGLAAAELLGAVAVKYPKPATEYDIEPAEKGARKGIRVGIIARPHEEDAWRAACEYFPDDRKGQLTHQLAMKTSDSLWHGQLAAMTGETRGIYWLHPFQNYKTFCPYLVGDYKQVATEIKRYLKAGHDTLILDVPLGAEEMAHTITALASASEGVQCTTYSRIG